MNNLQLAAMARGFASSEYLPVVMIVGTWMMSYLGFDARSILLLAGKDPALVERITSLSPRPSDPLTAGVIALAAVYLLVRAWQKHHITKSLQPEVQT